MIDHHTTLQAITTDRLRATNKLGVRIRAIASGGMVSIPYDYSLSNHQNHLLAAQTLRDKLKWNATIIGGTMHDGKSCFVLIETSNTIVATIPEN